MDYKQIIIVRTDLKMGKGKLAAAVAHASLEAFKKASSKAVKAWELSGNKKVVTKVGSKEELMALKEAAERNKLPCALIKDAGKTQVTPGSETALCIGPAKSDDIDRITKHLKLL